jgi:hypothetical protein
MNKILLGFIAIGLLMFVGCDKEKQKGCTEPNAINFDSAAEENDGSCRYEDDNNNDSNTDQDSTGNNNGGTDTGSTRWRKMMSIHKGNTTLVLGFMMVDWGSF